MAFRRVRPDLRPASSLRARVGQFVAPCALAGSLVAENTFSALGETHDISASNTWNDPRRSALWLYNLHYFDDLNAVDAPHRLGWHRELVQRWIRQNPPGEGAGWQPYPVSRRLVNWVKWALRTEAGTGADIMDSIAAQARWLERHLEYHLGGNHLLANSKALVYAGALFQGSEADGWLARGTELLSREIDEQVLGDGGHYERSPMYHAAVLEDVLDSINLLRCFDIEVPTSWPRAAARMERWMEALSHPDGEIALFNDAAFGVVPSPGDLDAYARRLGLPAAGPTDSLTVLEPSGYVRIRRGEVWMACDCGPIGPDYLPAHAHADTLSFELSLGAERWLVNSGTSIYGTGPERQRQRGTPAHNTVSVDGADSSEVWAGFRVARRARANLLLAEASANQARIEASHDGYQRLPGRNVHRRRWTLDDDALVIDDHVTGKFSRAVAHFHFHPDVLVEKSGANALRLRRAGRDPLTFGFAGTKTLELARGTWHPRFGASIPNWNVRVAFEGSHLSSRLTWAAAP